MISDEKNVILSFLLQIFLHATDKNNHKYKCSSLQFYLNIKLSIV